MSADDEEATFGLVMPFVVCESNGGPFADEAFVAGFECGLFAEQLKSRPANVSRIASTVHSGIVPQLDLIAMREGWAMTAEDSGTEGWSYVTFKRPPKDCPLESHLRVYDAQGAYCGACNVRLL